MTRGTKRAKARNLWRNFQRNHASDDENIVTLTDSRQSDIIIPLIGPTGVGRSTFLNAAAGTTLTTVGHDLSSCTAKVQAFAISYPSKDDPHRRIVIVDTPGFDDIFVEDTEILRRISVWLARSYDERQKLAGVIYLHDISQTRMFKTSCRNIEMFRRLWGDRALKNVVLGTTKWSEVKCDVGLRREQQLGETYWKHMLNKGATMARFQDTQKSALAIVDLVVDSNQSQALPIQQELVDLHQSLPEIRVGESLYYTLDELSETPKNMAPRLQKGKEESPGGADIYEENKKQLENEPNLSFGMRLWNYSTAGIAMRPGVNEKTSQKLKHAKDIAVADPRDSDLIILILGVSGAGKSTFINAAAEKEATTVGHDLNLCTKAIHPVIVPHPDYPTRRIVLVDTPGFNDTWDDDNSVLSRIVDWLDVSCNGGMTLAGIIFLVDISQARFPQAKETTIQKLFSPSGIKNIVLATTKWDHVETDVGQLREQQISEQNWAGLEMFRFGSAPSNATCDAHASAWTVIKHILEKDPNDALPIQEELAKFLNPPTTQPRMRGGFFTILFGRHSARDTEHVKEI